jgi:hypothetical protein
VGARERLPVGHSDVRFRNVERALRVIILGSGERRTAIGEKKTLLENTSLRYILHTSKTTWYYPYCHPYLHPALR